MSFIYVVPHNVLISFVKFRVFFDFFSNDFKGMNAISLLKEKLPCALFTMSQLNNDSLSSYPLSPQVILQSFFRFSVKVSVQTVSNSQKCFQTLIRYLGFVISTYLKLHNCCIFLISFLWTLNQGRS